jgi:hypothetical protein
LLYSVKFSYNQDELSFLLRVGFTLRSAGNDWAVPAELCSEIPAKRRKETELQMEVLGDTIVTSFPFLPGAAQAFPILQTALPAYDAHWAILSLSAEDTCNEIIYGYHLLYAAVRYLHISLHSSSPA